jgi:ATP-binding cassette, subfamily B, bacterial
MPHFFAKSPPLTDPLSGLSGSTNIGEPAPPPRQPVALRARLRRGGASLLNTARGVPRVLALVWRASPALTIALALATVAAGLVPLAVATITRLLINAVAHATQVRAAGAPEHSTVGPVLGVVVHTTTTGAVVIAVALQFGVFVLNAVAGSVRNITTELLQERVSQHIQFRVMAHASRLELAFFEDGTSYDLMRQAQEQAASRPVAMISNVFGALQCAVTFASLVALLAALNPWVAVAVLLAPVPAFLADARFGKMGFMVAVWSSPIRRRMQYISTLVTTDTYAKEVKLFGLGGYLAQRFRELGLVYYRRHRRQAVSRSAAATGFGALTTLVGSISYLYVALLAVAGSVTMGDLVMYTAAAIALQASVQTMFQELTGIYEDNLYLDVLYRLLDTRPAITRPAHPVPMATPVCGHIVFEHVTFRYPGAETPALRDVCFEIAPGQTMAIVGNNGAGKSTLVKLICRLYDPDQGRILLDGVDLRQLDPDELRATISGTFQDYVTYQATAAENITLGDVQHIGDRRRAQRAAVKGGADELITGLPLGYDTPLGKWFDKGVNLSGGEWQKVALSRAFMRDARLLVFDEPTAALDPHSEHDLFLRLRSLAHGRTAVYISHRFSTVRQADRILLLSGGTVAEQGTHADLMARGGQYADMFLLQASAYVDPPAQPPAEPTVLTKG